MSVLFTTHPEFLLHDSGHHHPERPERLGAIRTGVDEAGLGDALVEFEPIAATRDQVIRVHPGRYVQALEELSLSGGGPIDGDTSCGPHSFDAALLAAGAGLEAARRLEAGEGSAAFCAVRPPGHHATPTRAMGFCLMNNVAVTATALADRGERVLIVDYDAHHGNGTQDIFYRDPRVVYFSIHEYPLYPGTGSMHETGEGPGAGSTINVPVPAGTTGDVFRHAVDVLLAPLVDSWKPTWLLVSAGYDAHRRDPITGLNLTSGDFADITEAVAVLVPPGRRLFFLEGGYDLRGLADSAGASLAALVGTDHRPEAASAGGPGTVVVDAVRRIRDTNGWA